MSKYIRFSGVEAISIQKSLLNAELELLRSSKNLNQYKTFRHEEHTLKIKAKSSLDVLKEQIKILDKILPKSDIPKLVKPKSPEAQHIEEIPSDGSLDSELQAIQRRLAQLG
jgi:hypothetical protein